MDLYGSTLRRQISGRFGGIGKEGQGLINGRPKVLEPDAGGGFLWPSGGDLEEQGERSRRSPGAPKAPLVS